MDEHHRYNKMPDLAEPSIEELLALKDQLAAEKAAAQKLEARLVKKGAKGEKQCAQSRHPGYSDIYDVTLFFCSYYLDDVPMQMAAGVLAWLRKIKARQLMHLMILRSAGSRWTTLRWPA